MQLRVIDANGTEMNETKHDAETLEAIVFVGRSLGPFFRYDPKREGDIIGPSYDAIATMNAQKAAAEWPFADERVAFHSLCLMQEGMEDDFDEMPMTWEYRRLFAGPAKKAAPPWGSVYTDEDGVMFGASWVALREWMRNNGLAVEGEESREPDDHIGLMLEMMAWLAENRPELVDEYLSQHLLTWSFHFLDRVIDVAQHPFFEGLAELAKSSLQGMQQALQLNVVTPRFYR